MENITLKFYTQVIIPNVSHFTAQIGQFSQHQEIVEFQESFMRQAHLEIQQLMEAKMHQMNLETQTRFPQQYRQHYQQQFQLNVSPNPMSSRFQTPEAEAHILAPHPSPGQLDNHEDAESFRKENPEARSWTSQWVQSVAAQQQVSARPFEPSSSHAQLPHQQSRQAVQRGGDDMQRAAGTDYRDQPPRATRQSTGAGRPPDLSQAPDYPRSGGSYRGNASPQQHGAAEAASEQFSGHTNVPLHAPTSQRSQSSLSSRGGVRPEVPSRRELLGISAVPRGAQGAYPQAGFASSTTRRGQYATINTPGASGTNAEYTQRGAYSTVSYSGPLFLQSVEHTARSPHSSMTSGVSDALPEEREGQHDEPETIGAQRGSEGYISEVGTTRSSSSSSYLPSASQVSEPFIRDRSGQRTEGAHSRAAERTAAAGPRNQSARQQQTAAQASLGRIYSSDHKIVVENAQFSGNSGRDVGKMLTSLQRQSSRKPAQTPGSTSMGRRN